MKKQVAILLSILIIVCLSFPGCGLMRDKVSDDLRDTMIAAIQAQDYEAAKALCHPDLYEDEAAFQSGIDQIYEIIADTTFTWKIASREKSVSAGVTTTSSVYKASEAGINYELQMTVVKDDGESLVYYFFVQVVS